MAKAKLEFDLEIPEDRDAFKRTTLAWELTQVISEFSDKSIRRRVKYESDDYTEKELELLDKLRTELWELVAAHGCADVIG